MDFKDFTKALGNKAWQGLVNGFMPDAPAGDGDSGVPAIFRTDMV